MKLCHQPGAGASTVALRTLWNLRTSFPCAILKEGANREHALECIADMYLILTYEQLI